MSEASTFSVVDAAGATAAHTGVQCTPGYGHSLAPDVAIQGNIGQQVLETMAEAFAADAGLGLAEWLMTALEAGATGGDKRGRQSSLRVHTRAALDICVDERAAPVRKLCRILRIAHVQLAPFVRGMPRRGAPAGPGTDGRSEMILRPPPDRPEGDGGRPNS